MTSKNVTIVGIGDLSADIYVKDDLIMGISGGGSVWNSLVNAASLGCPAKAIAIAGRDALGSLCVADLAAHGVDTSEVKLMTSLSTRRSFFTVGAHQEVQGSFYCPTNKKKNWYSAYQFDTVYPSVLDQDKGILISDNLEDNEFECLLEAQKAGWQTAVNMSHIGHFRDESNRDLLAALAQKFDMIQIKARVLDYFLDRFELTDRLDFVKMTGARLVIVTMGKDGWCIYYKDESGYHARKYRVNTTELRDATGFWDALFGCAVATAATPRFHGDSLGSDYSEALYACASTVLPRAMASFGARGHLTPLDATDAGKDPALYCA